MARSTATVAGSNEEMNMGRSYDHGGIAREAEAADLFLVEEHGETPRAAARAWEAGGDWAFNGERTRCAEAGELNQ